MTPRAAGRTYPCTPTEARTRRIHARSFLDVAELLLSENSREAHVAAALAVLAGIAAADSICGLSVGKWSRGKDHKEAVRLLYSVALGDPSVPAKLNRLLDEKDAAHYSPHLVTPNKARSMVRMAQALVAEAVLH